MLCSLNKVYTIVNIHFEDEDMQHGLKFNPTNCELVLRETTVFFERLRETKVYLISELLVS